MRLVSLLFSLALATPAAAEGVLVWHDDAAMAVKLAILSDADPAEVAALHVLAETRRISATMTAVSADGRAVGLCHQLRDDNASPVSIRGYDRRGQQIWRVYAQDLHRALEAALPEGAYLAQGPDRLTFACADGGAAGPGGLAFDIIVLGGPHGADGYIPDGKAQDYRLRLHLAGDDGALLAAGLVRQGGLALTRNPLGVDNPTLGGALTLPETGQGRALWGDRAIRFKGEPIGDGHDFAWYIPPQP